MSKLTEILKVENAPREEPMQKRTVRLVKMGAFLRAYDWSAWLLKRYGSTLNVSLDRGDGTSHIFVGFPVSSADKFVPEGCESIKDEDGVESQWIFDLTMFPPEESYDLLEEEYVRWSNEMLTELEAEQLEKKRKKEARRQATAAGGQLSQEDDIPYTEGKSASPIRLTDVAREILRFPLESRSPQECVRFIRHIQSELLEML